MSNSDKPSLGQFFKPALVGLVFSAGLSYLAMAVPFNAFWQVLIVYVLAIWLSIKVTQTAVAYFLKREYASSTIFWYLLVAGIAGGLLALALVGLVSLATGMSISGDSQTSDTLGAPSQIIASVLSVPASALVGALLFRSGRNWVPAWRPLSAYWRPFYAGFKFTGLDATPEAAPTQPAPEAENPAPAHPAPAEDKPEEPSPDSGGTQDKPAEPTPPAS